MAKAPTINVKDAIKDAEIRAVVRVVGVKRLRVRLWVAWRLIKFAFWLIYGRATLECDDIPEVDIPLTDFRKWPIEDESGSVTGQAD